MVDGFVFGVEKVAEVIYFCGKVVLFQCRHAFNNDIALVLEHFRQDVFFRIKIVKDMAGRNIGFLCDAGHRGLRKPVFFQRGQEATDDAVSAFRALRFVRFV